MRFWGVCSASKCRYIKNISCPKGWFKENYMES